MSVARPNPVAAACVLLHPKGGADSDLLSALSRRSMPVRPSTDRCHAMAQLCLAAQRGGPVVLLLDRLERDPAARALAGSAHRYVPGLTVWTYDPKGSPQLRAYVESAEVDEDEIIDAVRASAAPAPGFKATLAFRGPPNLRLTDDPPVEPKPRPATAAPAAAKPAEPLQASENGDPELPAGLYGVLTDEELAMLLADDTGRGHTERG